MKPLSLPQISKLKKDTKKERMQLIDTIKDMERKLNLIT